MGHELIVLYELELMGRWHVGSGFRRGLVDHTVKTRKLRHHGVVATVPVIPGSAIKGSLRHRCEQIAQACGLDWQDPHVVAADAVAAFVPLHRSGLIVDRLFGTRYQGNCLFVSDCQWTGDYYGPAHLDMTNRVTIDRGLGTAREQRLFSAEYLEAVSSLQGRIDAFHREGELELLDAFPFEYALLLGGLTTLDRLGGHRAVGMGRAATRITKVVYNGAEIAERTWAECLELLELYGEGRRA